MKKLALAVLLISTAAFAQDAPKPVDPAPAETKATPAPPSTPTHWTLDLDAGDINTLNQCIGELPFKTAQPFVAKVQKNLKPVQ